MWGPQDGRVVVELESPLSMVLFPFPIPRWAMNLNLTFLLPVCACLFPRDFLHFKSERKHIIRFSLETACTFGLLTCISVFYCAGVEYFLCYQSEVGSQSNWTQSFFCCYMFVFVWYESISLMELIHIWLLESGNNVYSHQASLLHGKHHRLMKLIHIWLLESSLWTSANCNKRNGQRNNPLR